VSLLAAKDLSLAYGPKVVLDHAGFATFFEYPPHAGYDPKIRKRACKSLTPSLNASIN